MSCHHDREFWNEFLNLYRSFPYLWWDNPDIMANRENYRHERAKANAKLLEYCLERYPNADGAFVQKKIHNFRCGFQREYRKKKQLEFLGKTHRPVLWYYKKLLFLVDEENVLDLLEEENFSVKTVERQYPSKKQLKSAAEQAANAAAAAAAAAQSQSLLMKEVKKEVLDSHLEETIDCDDESSLSLKESSPTLESDDCIPELSNCDDMTTAISQLSNDSCSNFNQNHKRHSTLIENVKTKEIEKIYLKPLPKIKEIVMDKAKKPATYTNTTIITAAAPASSTTAPATTTTITTIPKLSIIPDAHITLVEDQKRRASNSLQQIGNAKKLRIRELYQLANRAVVGFEHLSNDLTNHQDDNDGCSLAGKKIANDLREMTKTQRILAEKLISEVMFNGKMNLLTCKYIFKPS